MSHGTSEPEHKPGVHPSATAACTEGLALDGSVVVLGNGTQDLECARQHPSTESHPGSVSHTAQTMEECSLESP